MIIGLMPARNESWVIRYSAQAALKWVDRLIVFLHACTDQTAAIADLLRVETERVSVIVEPNPDWREAEHYQRMLEVGRRIGGDVFAIVDGDEILTANLVPTIRATLEALAPAQLLELPWLDLWRGLDQYRVDKCGTAPFAFRDRPDVHWRPQDDGYQLHMRNPRPIFWRYKPADPGPGGMLHLQRVVWRRAQARQAKYKMHELLEWPTRRGSVRKIEERHQRSIDEENLLLAPVPPHWWAHGIDRGLIDLDAEPWEVGEVKRLLAEHGRERFEGISLGGIGQNEDGADA